MWVCASCWLRGCDDCGRGAKAKRAGLPCPYFPKFGECDYWTALGAPVLAIYQENGGRAVVQVLRDTSDKQWERYRLKVVSTIRPGVIAGEHENGHEFEVAKMRGTAAAAMWDLAITDPDSRH